MMLVRILLGLTLLSSTLVAQEPNRSPSNQPGGTNATASPVNPLPQSSAIRILTPVAGQLLTSDFADLHFELLQPNPTGEANFMVQIDGSDPVSTSGTQYTFSGLHPGSHTITVTEVDANGTPLAGARAAVQFSVQSATANQGETNSSTQAPVVNRSRQPGPASPDLGAGADALPAPPLASAIPAELRGEPAGLPSTGSALPLLAIVGFSALLAGAISAMRKHT